MERKSVSKHTEATQSTLFMPSCICDAMSLLFTRSKKSKLDSTFTSDPDVETAIQYLNERLNINAMEAVILSIVYEHGEDEDYLSISSIAEHIGCTVCQAKSWNKVFDSLVQRRLIHQCFFGNKRTLSYFMERDAMDALGRDEAYEYHKPEFHNDTMFFALLDEYYSMRFGRKIGIKELNMLLDEALEAGNGVPVVEKMREMCMELSDEDRHLFMFMACAKFKNNDDNINHKLFAILFQENVGRELAYSLMNGDSLVAAGLVTRNNPREKRPMRCSYRISNDAAKALNLSDNKANIDDSDDDMEEEDQEMLYNFMTPEDIVEKKMFYNQKEADEVNNLARLLTQKNYLKVQEGLKKKGMRGGLNILFYGGPGTGKTETVKQLAKSTGRELVIVDFSQIRSKWIGESEKNVRKIFTKYRSMVESSYLAPILLLNEADALLGRRLESVQHSSDRSENTIQNILLQEMENLDGILIATTNLASNLDSAFDRRFLVKLEFEKPSVEVRENIWMAMVPELSSDEASELATDFDIAGGNMENVVRKRLMEEILYQREVSLERMRELCEQETISTKGRTKRIGF